LGPIRDSAAETVHAAADSGKLQGVSERGMMTTAAAMAKRVVRACFNRVGLDIAKLKNSPDKTLLGLKNHPFNTIIDVGANTGQFARWISTFFPNAKILSFEPLPQPFQELTVWAQTQDKRVILFNQAIGDTEGEAEIFLHEDHTPSSSLLQVTPLAAQYYPLIEKQRRITVRKTTLDSALADILPNLSQPILVKLDVQGYEDRVIAGAARTFKTASACMIEVSLDILYEEQADFKRLIIALAELGFQYAGNVHQTYDRDGHCIFLDAIFVRRK
jgi:FkbM family methyltransferase